MNIRKQQDGVGELHEAGECEKRVMRKEKRKCVCADKEVNE